MSGYWAVVPAAGTGSRMGSAVPKQYLKLLDRTVLDFTLDTLLNHSLIQGVVVAIGSDDRLWEHSEYAAHSRIHLVTGGAERVHSVQNALQKLATFADVEDWVLVHDAARPCISPKDISTLIDTVSRHDIGGILGAPVPDTLKRVDSKNGISATVDRSGLWRALTPQMFRLGLLQTSLATALQQGLPITDECSAIEAAGYVPLMVQGSAANIKITHPEDLQIAESLLR